MKNRYVFAACVMVLASSQFLSAAQEGRKSSLAQKKLQPGVMYSLFKKKDVKNGLKVSFAAEDTVFEITPRKEKIKRGKPGSGFSREAAPLALRLEAKKALVALTEAKCPVVLSVHNETIKPRSIRCELLNAQARQDAPKRLVAVKKACDDLCAQLAVAAISATRVNLITRSDAFREKNK